MFDEIIKTYAPFHDARILKASYELGNDRKSHASLLIRCKNNLHDGRYERIEITFLDVKSYSCLQEPALSNVFVNTALIEAGWGLIMFDFFPVFKDNQLWHVEHSGLKIKCMAVRYVVMGIE